MALISSTFDKISASIAIDGRCFDGTKNGYSTFTNWVVGVLVEAGCEVTIVSNKPIKTGHYKNLKKTKIIQFGSKKDLIWEQVSLLYFLQKNKCHIYFSGQNIGLPLLYFGKTKLILGVLDMIPQRFPDHYIKTMRDKWHFLHLQRMNIKKADNIITISNSSKDDIEYYMGGKNISRVYIRISPSKTTNIIRQRSSDRYRFLYIGGNEWRKRVTTMCSAFVRFLGDHPTAELRLVGDGYDDILSKLTINQGQKQQIKVLGRISDNDLAKELSMTTAVVFPSIFEGYGLPIAEAIMIGKPIICGNGGSQKEIGGKIAYYVDPDDADSIYRGFCFVIKPAYLIEFSKNLKERQDFLSDKQHDLDLLEVFKK